MSHRASEDHQESNISRKSRKASVYDAVDGRVGPAGFLSRNPFTSADRGRITGSTKPIRPEEVLFRVKGAPVRYAENDFYFANENLKCHQRLPDSDLLKAVHQYTSDFYGTLYGDVARLDFRSMNETALIAIGILLEEAMDERLGENGDMVFTEPEQNDHGPAETLETKTEIRGCVPNIESPPYVSDDTSDESEDGRRKRLRAGPP